MKKLIVATMLLGACLAHAGDVTWSGSFTSATQDGVDMIDNWFVGMYSGTFGSINIANLSENLEASTVIAIDHSGPEFTWTEQIQASTVNVTDNIDVFTVIFNNTILENATSYLVVDSSAFNVGAAVAPTPPVAYGLGDAAGTWQAVPEPATAMLLALGGGLAWLVRLKQRLG
ncbi:MAG: PEP-CTERM sorting domain-containing protein [Verrucomicrobia bacterium]|nr:PEP-CTERM sorting domain-containing protein [Verrucomicrobiota bacterium]